MAMPWEHHHQIIVETYSARAAGSKSEVRVRPIEGQMFPQTMQVQWSRKLRIAHPVGTRFRIWVKESDLSVFADFEREMIRSRIMAGLRRSTKKAGRKPLDPDKVARIERALAKGGSINETARKLKVGVGTVHRIKTRMNAAA